MRKLILLFTAIVLGTLSTTASTTDGKVAIRNAYLNNNSFIFVENGITFSVFPDGEFDFFIGNRIGHQNRNITFNSGFDYSPFAQYDDYGAVIQVENVPVFYDHYGRVSTIGAVDIAYRNGRVFRVGNMHVYYNRRGFYDYHTGYINRWNRNYVYRPFHQFFLRPAVNLCFVNTTPYRRFYNPIRYTYYNPYRYNTRRTYATIGREHRYNKVRNKRAKVYRNDKRVAVRTNRAGNRTNKAYRNIAQRGNTKVTRNRTVTQRATRNANRTNSRKTLGTKREVYRTPRSTTVTKTTRAFKKPVTRTTPRTVSTRTVKTPRARGYNVSTRNNTNQRMVNKTPTRSRNNVSRSIQKRNNNSRSTTLRSSRR